MQPSLRAAWQARLLAEVIRIAYNEETSRFLVVDAVRLEGEFPSTDIVILARQKRNIDRTIGFRWGNIWPWLESYGPDSAGFVGLVAWSNFEEALLEVPDDCGNGDVYWIT